VAKHSAANPELVATRQIRRKQQEQEVGDLSRDEKEAIFNRKRRIQQGRCYYCQQALTANGGELDHMHPICKGGTNTDFNLVAACFSCNREKHNKTIDEYRLWMRKNGYTPQF
jgi:5-methylcytosine-specific restriction endonuclease McrA